MTTIDAFPLALSSAAATQFHRRIREAGPVHQAIDPDGIPVWIITRYEDVADLLVDPRIVNKRPAGTHSPGGVRRSPGIMLPPMLARNLLNMMPPDHRRIRALAAPAFSRRRMSAIRPTIEANVHRLLDELTPNAAGAVDLFAGLTSPLPAVAIAEILGVNESELATFRENAGVVALIDPSDPASDKLRTPALAAIVMVMAGMIHRKREDPGDDVISEWIAARDEEDRLTEPELISLATLVFAAGFENSVYQIANAIGLLADDPDRAGVLQLAADEDGWRERTEELLVDAAPISYAIRRFCTEDLDIGDVTIPAGDPIMLSLRAAADDPARGDRPALPFGRGPHYCLGAELATMQLEIATRELFRRFPEIQLVSPLEELQYRMAWRNQGPIELPVYLEFPTRF